MLVEISVMEQRYQAVMAVVQDGWKVSEVADRLGVSRQAVHKWITRYERAGLPALADHSHRPQSCSHQIAPELEALICELRCQHPGWGPRRILHQLRPRLPSGQLPLERFNEGAEGRYRADLCDPWTTASGDRVARRGPHQGCGEPSGPVPAESPTLSILISSSRPPPPDTPRVRTGPMPWA